MDYTFGTQGHMEVLRTKGGHHTHLTGFQQTVQDYSSEKITDRYRVVRKLKTAEDGAGSCYDWYEIDRHYREIDRTKPLQDAHNKNVANIDYISMMAGIDLPEEEGEHNADEE